MAGSCRFGEFRRGLPLISPTMLSRRLASLRDAGVITRHTEGPEIEYRLTEAGEQLRPIIEALGLWGHRFVRRALTRTELDPRFFMWDLRRGLAAHAIPGTGRRVIRLDMLGVTRGHHRWWLIVETDEIDLCLHAPGFEPALIIRGHIRDFVAVWLGEVSTTQALRDNRISLKGQSQLLRSFSQWFGPSPFARLARAHSE